MEKICDKNKCTGCGACQNTCMRNAIKMEFDKEGFIFPVIDQARCVDCQQCVKVCPVNYPRELKEPITSYKGSSNNVEIKKQSSSGGIFSELAKVVLSEGGSVFGAYLDDTLSVRHILVEDEEELWKLRGSKYIGSDTSNVFRLVKEKLSKGETVLFSGTPCQIAGLKNYLKENTERLLTCDFVCHGVASKSLFDMFIKNEELKTKKQITRFYFRTKERKYTSISCVFVFNDKSMKISRWFRTSFGYAFSAGKINRISCSMCPYSSTNRVSDITLADCIHDLNSEQRRLGCSFIIVNTKIGEEVINKCNVSISSFKISEIAKYQSHLSRPQTVDKSRELIMKDIDKGYTFLLKNYITPPKRNIFKSIQGRIRYAKTKFHKR